MLFNKSNNGSQELKERTGSYYANNEFAKIATDVMLAEAELIKLVGDDVYFRAKNHYQGSSFNPNGTAVNDQLVILMQIPIAYRATLNFYQSNLVSHKDTGRKVDIDNDNEKMAWEWMIDADNEAHIRKMHSTTDLLINFLESKKITEWLNSDNRKAARRLFVNSEALFQDAYPIDLSARFFYTVLPFNREVQQHTIRKALGAKYEPLLNMWINQVPEVEDGSGSGSGSGNSGIPAAPVDQVLEEILPLVQQVIPLLVMVKAIKRLSVQALPDGVVQQLKSGIQSRNASQPPLLDVIEWNVKKLNQDAQDLLDEIKQILQSADPEANTYPLIPENKESNKYFRT